MSLSSRERPLTSVTYQVYIFRRRHHGTCIVLNKNLTATSTSLMGWGCIPRDRMTKVNFWELFVVSVLLVRLVGKRRTFILYL